MDVSSPHITLTQTPPPQGKCETTQRTIPATQNLVGHTPPPDSPHTTVHPPRDPAGTGPAATHMEQGGDRTPPSNLFDGDRLWREDSTSSNDSTSPPVSTHEDLEFEGSPPPPYSSTPNPGHPPGSIGAIDLSLQLLAPLITFDAKDLSPIMSTYKRPPGIPQGTSTNTDTHQPMLGHHSFHVLHRFQDLSIQEETEPRDEDSDLSQNHLPTTTVSRGADSNTTPGRGATSPPTPPPHVSPQQAEGTAQGGGVSQMALDPEGHNLVMPLRHLSLSHQDQHPQTHDIKDSNPLTQSTSSHQREHPSRITHPDVHIQQEVGQGDHLGSGPQWDSFLTTTPRDHHPHFGAPPTGLLPNIPRQVTSEGTQTLTHMGSSPPPHTGFITRCPIFPPPLGNMKGSRHDNHPPGAHQLPGTIPPLTICVHHDTNLRSISSPQDEEQDSITTPRSVEALFKEVRTLMTDAAKFSTRATFLKQMSDGNLFIPWATTAQPNPPFVKENSKLLAKIREIRKEAARKVQLLAQEEFQVLSTKYETEGNAIINTIEQLMQGKAAAVRDQRLYELADSIGKSRSNLETKLAQRRAFLQERQPTDADWEGFFEYCSAYRRHKNQGPFDISPEDRAEADRETALDRERWAREALMEDGEEPSSPARHPTKRKRDPSPNRPSYRIPKVPKPNDRQRSGQRSRGRGQQPRGGHNHRSSSSTTSSSPRDQDFGTARPPSTHRNVYHRSGSTSRDHPRGGKGGRDQYNHSQNTQKQLDVLQKQLDRLRRQ